MTLVKKSLGTIALIIAPITAFGQLSMQSDTLKIQEVVITSKQISSGQPGFKFYHIDSARMREYPLYSLTDLLNETTPLFIKYYGSGGTATSSFRGTSAGHTQVAWNGININDPMLGQSDFSLIPSGLIENILVSFGGASMDLGNGAIGGIINLENDPLWKNRISAEGFAGTGSFGRYSGLFKLYAGNGLFESVTKGFISYGRNDFRYFDPDTVSGPGWRDREHNSVLQKSLMQEFYYKKSGSVFSARFWYNSSARDLPGSTQYGYAGERQRDESFRSLLGFDRKHGKVDLFANAALMYSDLDYTSRLYAIDSWNKASTVVIKGGITDNIGNYTRIKLVISDEMNSVKTNNYEKNITRNNASVTLSAEHKKGRRLGAVALLRQTLDDKTFLIPDFSAGLEYRIFKGEEHYLKINFSRNSKIPSLNDRFWNPGGNPDLKNEYAYSWEGGYKLEHQISGTITIEAETDYFNNYIRDMIQWRPGDSYYWVADNIGSVNSGGLESSLAVNYKANDLSVNINGVYSYTRAYETGNSSPETPGKQLIYIPRNQGNGAIRLSYRNVYAMTGAYYTGKVYINSDNSEYLNSHLLNNIAGGFKFNLKNSIVDLGLRVDNVFDVSYQTIEYYPQPGRSFFLTLSFQMR